MLTLKTTATVTKINHKSSSPCFKDLKVGDVIEFRVSIAKNYNYAIYIKYYNTRIKTESKLSFNQIHNVLSCCELGEVSDGH